MKLIFLAGFVVGTFVGWVAAGVFLIIYIAINS